MAKRIPFDYELWKQHPEYKVFTRYGIQVTGLTDVSSLGIVSAGVSIALTFFANTTICSCGANGIFLLTGSESALDLFIELPAPVRIVKGLEVTGRNSDGEHGLFTCAPNYHSSAVTVVLEQQPDGTWKVIGTDQLAAEEADID